MSSLPGYTLEAYLAWAYDLTVEGQADANFSLALAEAIGTAKQVRKHLTAAEFAAVVARFEQHRERVEQLLEDFDEDNQSWRGYAGACFDFLSEEDDKWVFDYLKNLPEART